MNSTANSFFPDHATCGFKKDAGYWEIDLGSPEIASAAFLNELTIKMVENYLKAFSFLCRPVELRYDLMTLAEPGKPTLTKEGEVLHVATLETPELIQALKNIVNSPTQWFFSTLFLDCDLLVFIPNTENIENPTWLPIAGQFYIGHVMEPDDNDRLIPVDCGLSFDTMTDVWVSETLSPTSTQQDNRICAAKNQPLLESALRALEAFAGKPIVDWGSRYYHEQIYKYGFHDQMR